LHWIKAWYARALALIAASLIAAPEVRSQADDAEEAAWAAARRADTYESYQRYLSLYPVGRYAAEAFREMTEEAIGADIDETDSLDPSTLY
jgi:hypothetical protein